MTEPTEQPLPGRGRGKNYVPPKHQHHFQVSPFTRLIRVHALMAAGEASMAVALADSLFLSITPGEARGRVLLFLAVSFAPFLILAKFIGPVIDRMPGGRRLLVLLIATLRAIVMVLMVSQLDSLLLFPLAFVAMVLNKTYSVSKSALVPALIKSDNNLVEANAKLGVTAGIVGFSAAIPAGILSLISSKVTLIFGAAIFAVAALNALRFPKQTVAKNEPEELEVQELRQPGIVIAVSAMSLVRASVGFVFFHLAFWFADPQRAEVVGTDTNGLWTQVRYHFGPQFGTMWFGIAVSMAAIGSLLGNLSAKRLNKIQRIEYLLVIALAIIGVAGLLTALTSVTITALFLMALVNYAAAIGNMAFESIVQRDAPDANRGRALANYYTRFQLMWVAAGIIPVLLKLPGVVGFGIAAGIGFSGAFIYWIGLRQIALGAEPASVVARLRQRFSRLR
ncbi:MAG: MFS transporter [Actinomycetota bacterium]|nr:MFS transporter [Actinomycetota bacterium]